MKLADLNIFKRLRDLEEREDALDLAFDEIRKLYAEFVDSRVSRSELRLEKINGELVAMRQSLDSSKIIDLDAKMIDLDGVN